MVKSRKVLFGVSVDQSIDLMGPLPAVMAAKNWNVHVVSDPGPLLADLAKIQGVETHPLRMRRQPSIARDLVSLSRWFRAVGSTRPDVVIVATPKASLLGLIAAWVFRVPVRVYWLWGLRLETVKGLPGAFLYTLERLTANCATHVLAVSPSLAALYIQKRLASEKKLIVLGNGSSRGVDLRRFRPALRKEKPALDQLAAQLGLEPQVPTIGIVGRQHKDKGFHTLLAALSHPEMLGVACQVLVVGHDESDGRFRELSRALSVPIVFVSATKQIENYYRLMTVLCLPSLREGMPNVVLEALASGTPVVTTDATGAVDSIENDVVGLLVTRGSAEELAKSLRLLVTDRVTQKRLSSNARDWVGTRFREYDVVNLHADLISSLGLESESSAHFDRRP